MKILQNYYPNRLAAVYLVEVDYLVRFVYSLIKPFINANTARLIHIIDVKELKKYFNDDQLLVDYGGTRMMGVTYSQGDSLYDNEGEEHELEGRMQGQKQLKYEKEEDDPTIEFMSLLNNTNDFFDEG